MKKRTKILICAVSALLAVGVILYPLISNYLAEKQRSLVQTQYNKVVQQMDNSEIEAAREAAHAYNGTLLNITEKAYSKQALRQAAESYEDLLNVRGDGVMGYVDVPKIGVKLPIYHGTDESSLERGVGHLLGSSLPVGGTGTHCVLTGHSGMAAQKMFSDLEQVSKGDIFYLHILDETLAYVVLDINTVLPEDTSKLGIDAARDSCTLVTCTPFGANTHRLLVRGERIEYEMAEKLVEEAEYAEAETGSTWTHEYLKGIGAGLLGIVGVFALAKLIYTAPKRARQRRAAAMTERRLIGEVREQRAPKPTWEARTPRKTPCGSLFQPRKRGKHEAIR